MLKTPVFIDFVYLSHFDFFDFRLLYKLHGMCQIEKIIKVRIRAEELNTIKARLLEDNDRKTVQDD